MQPRSQGSRISRAKHKQTCSHTHQPLCWVHHVHFLGYTWVDDPLEIVALTHHLHTFCFRVVLVLVSSKFPPNFHLKKSKNERGNHVRTCIVSCTIELSCFNTLDIFVFLVLISGLEFLPVPPFSRPFCSFVNILRKHLCTVCGLAK